MTIPSEKCKFAHYASDSCRFTFIFVFAERILIPEPTLVEKTTTVNTGIPGDFPVMLKQPHMTNCEYRQAKVVRVFYKKPNEKGARTLTK